MKKLIALLLAALLLFSLAACGETPAEPVPEVTGEPAAEPAAESDYAYVRGKGTLVVGITDFAPMNYKDKNGEWIGFDADMAKSFADNLGVGVEFVEIKWENKLQLLEDKTVDCVWSGMPLTDEVKQTMECSKPYCDNGLTIIVPADNAGKYHSVEDCKYLRFAVEAGSAGETKLNDLGYAVTSVKRQKDALSSVKQGTADAAVINALAVGSAVGSGTNYENLTPCVQLSSEELVIGFRKGSDLADELNIFFAAAYADGFMQKVAERYGVQTSLIQQII